MALHSLRERMPVLAFVLLAVVCLALLGLACACMSDHAMEAIQSALAAIPALPALIEIWTVLVALLGSAALLGSRHVSRAPTLAGLQRLLL